MSHSNRLQAPDSGLRPEASPPAPKGSSSRAHIAFWIGTTALAAILCRAEDWNSLGRDGARSRATAEVLGVPFAADAAWSGSGWVALPSGGVASPSVADGKVVVASTDGSVRAYGEVSGTLLWTANTGDTVNATPLVYRSRVWVPSTDGKLHVFRLADGVEINTILNFGNAMSSPVTDGSAVYVGRGFRFQDVVAYDAATAAALWASPAPLEQITYSSPAASGGKVYIGCDSGRYYCIDATSGAILWSYLTDGGVLLSSPLVVSDKAYLTPGGNSTKVYGGVHKDAVLGPVADWTYDYNSLEPAKTLAGYQSTNRAVSSPVLMGSLVVFLVRFDQYFDTNGDFVLDSTVMTEFLVGLNLASGTTAFTPVQIASVTVPSPNGVPQLGMCPSPAVFTAPSGNPLMAVASSIDANLRIYDKTGTAAQAAIALDNPTRASATAANTHLYVATTTRLYAFKCATNNAPPAPGGFSPTGDALLSAAPTVTWGAALDPDGDAVTYELRAAHDASMLNVDYSTSTAGTSAALPSAWPDDTRVFYSVRSKDSKGAYSPWSPLQTFWINKNSAPPLPPSGLTVTPGAGQATLSWTASPTTDVAGYWVATQQDTGAFGPYVSVGSATTAVVGGLANGHLYTFSLVARDFDGIQSSDVQASAFVPGGVSIGSTVYPSLDAAFASAAPGQTIQLGTGTFTLSATANMQPGVNLVGYAPHLTIIKGPGLDPVIRMAAGLGISNIRMLTITGGVTGVDANGQIVNVINVILRDMATGLKVPAGSKVLALECTVINNSTAGIDVGVASANVRNCILQGNGVGLTAAAGATLTLTYNDAAANATANYVNATPGAGSTGNVIPFLPDWREPDGAPNVDAGDPGDDFSQEPAPNGSRVNQGALGNTPWAAKTLLPAGVGGDSGRGGGGCGCLGLDALLVLGLLSWLRRRRIMLRAVES